MKLNFGEKSLVQLMKEAVSYMKHEGIINTVAHTWLILRRAAGIYVPIRDELEYMAYDSRYEMNEVYTEETDVKALAFFLPQYHAIPENDEWWGKGFTEWVNTEKAEPRFKGHYQPRRPHLDIGFYDLSKVETLKKQVELAKQHGIYGFCFYYYWFSGKRLLEKPVDMLLEHQEIDIQFCLCWANENWTRTWSGNQKDIMMAQNYYESDRHQFIDDIKKYIQDGRYIRIRNKPVIIVYNAGEIPERKETFQAWRNRARETGIGEILIWVCRTANHTANEMDILEDIDAEVEFPPHNFWEYQETWVRDLNLNGRSAYIYNYQRLVQLIQKQMLEEKETAVPVYRTCMMGWDNACRRENEWTTYYAFSLKSFYNWVGAIVSEARKKFNEENRFIFVNAWNEWAEGTYLEPDERYGYANINTFSKAVFGIPFEKRILMTSRVKKCDIELLGRCAQIAVHCHVYYFDTVEDIIRNIRNIPYLYDCYVTTDTLEKKEKLQKLFKERSGAQNVVVEVFPNRGRDMAPFLLQMRNHYRNYKYLCHIHSKKTGNSEYGDYWRAYLYRHLFGSIDNIKAIFCLFETDEKVGLIYPDTYPILKRQEEWGGNRAGCESLMEMLNISGNLNHDVEFPVGNMFWMRTEALKKILEHEWKVEDFPVEDGQVNLTLGHQLERIWKIAAENAGYKVQLIFNDTQSMEFAKNEKRRIVLFAHYDRNGIIDDSDVLYIRKLKEIVENVVFVTNSGALSDVEKNKVDRDVYMIIERENKGYDFGAWREAIKKIGYTELENYDELILANNSCYSPLLPLSNVFAEMDKKNCDLWGLTEFPHIEDGSFIGKECIKKHIQSYFVVFRKKILKSKCFAEYWDNLKEYDVMKEVVAHSESEMTDYFEQRGFIAKAYVEESGMLCKYLQNYAVPFDYPYQMLLMGNPLVKKKSNQTMWAEEKNLVDAIRKDFT